MKAQWKRVTLTHREMISEDTLCMTFTGKNLTPHVPGQFYLIKVKHKSGGVSREYSLSNAPNSNRTIELGIQRIEHGIVSNYLHSLNVGQKIEVQGPMGMYFNWDHTFSGDIVFIAGGAGIVPIMSMIRSLPKNKMTLVASFKTKKRFSYFNELLLLSKQLNLTFIPILTRESSSGWTGETKRIGKWLLKPIVQKTKEPTKYFICGRSEFVEDISRGLIESGVEQTDIQRERFG